MALTLGSVEARAGQEPAQLFLHAPGGADLAGRVIGREDGSQLGLAAFGEGVVAAHQQQPVGPGQVGGPSAPVVPIPGHAPSHLGDHVVRELDQVEVIHGHPRLGQQGPHRGAERR